MNASPAAQPFTALRESLGHVLSLWPVVLSLFCLRWLSAGRGAAVGLAWRLPPELGDEGARAAFVGLWGFELLVGLTEFLVLAAGLELIAARRQQRALTWSEALSTSAPVALSVGLAALLFRGALRTIAGAALLSNALAFTGSLVLGRAGAVSAASLAAALVLWLPLLLLGGWLPALALVEALRRRDSVPRAFGAAAGLLVERPGPFAVVMLVPTFGAAFVEALLVSPFFGLVAVAGPEAPPIFALVGELSVGAASAMVSAVVGLTQLGALWIVASSLRPSADVAADV